MPTLAALLSLTAAAGLTISACSTTESNPGTVGTGGGLGGAANAAGNGGMSQTPCAGTAPAAGSLATGGDAGSAATAGSAGALGQSGGGSGGSGPVPPKPSTGCSKAAAEPLAQFNKRSLMSGGSSRDFYTYLPTNYNPTRAYPTIFAFHPCGGSGNPTSNVPIQNESKENAIIISPQSKGGCYENQIRNSPEEAFFDATLEYAKENYCVDQNRIFAIGHSAGSWEAIILGCERADVIRAHAQVSGGLPIFVKPGECKGSVASLYLHDKNDNDNNIIGGYAARDRSLRINGCSDTTMPWAPAPCQAYQECKPGYPVVFCESTGKGHDRQDDFAPAAFWKFFSQF